MITVAAAIGDPCGMCPSGMCPMRDQWSILTLFSQGVPLQGYHRSFNERLKAFLWVPDLAGIAALSHIILKALRVGTRREMPFDVTP